MLSLALWILCAAATIGAGLGVQYMRGARVKPAPAAVFALHASLGAASLAVLLLALARGLPPSPMGTAGFGPTAAALLALTLAFGLRLARLSWRRRRPSELLVGTHATLAVAGLVVLLALVALR